MTKFQRLAAGLVAVAGLSSPAFALTPAQNDAIIGTTFELFISGATASDKAIENYIRNDLCSTAINKYVDYDGTTEAGNWFAISCTTGSAATTPVALQNQNIIVHKRTKIGAIWGSYPIALNSYVEFMNVGSVRGSGICAQAVPGTDPYRCTIAATGSALRGAPRHANLDECDYSTVAPVNPVATGYTGFDTICRRASLGTSDVESEMFLGVNLPNTSPLDNFAALTTAQLTALNRTRAFGQVFGVAVTNDVFAALQAAQSITVGAAAADGSNWPTLSRDTIRLLLSGQAATWSQAVKAVSLAGDKDSLTICRREQGSGTQASSNQFFFNYPCDKTAPPAQDTGGVQIDPNGLGSVTYLVKENTSSTFVKKCLKDANTGGAGVPVGKNTGAIGVLSFNGLPAAADGYSFVRVDGALPSLDNAIRGKYDFWYETQIAWNKTGNTAVETAFDTGLRGEMAKAARITASGIKGVGALPFNEVWDSGANNTAVTDLVTVTNPVMGSKHSATSLFSAAGSSPISCRPLYNALESNPTFAPDRNQ